MAWYDIVGVALGVIGSMLQLWSEFNVFFFFFSWAAQ